MITALAADMRAKLALAKRLKDTQSEVTAIELTLTELEKVAAKARQLTSALRICHQRLRAEFVSSSLAQAVSISQEVASSRERFASGESLLEKDALTAVSNKLSRLFEQVNGQWKAYAEARLSPYAELLALVVHLPEVASSEADINQLVAQLRSQTKEAPQTELQLAQFDQRLVNLGQRLEGIASLSDEVRGFILKVVARKATLADLTPGVTAWLGEGDRAGAFLITFAPRRS